MIDLRDDHMALVRRILAEQVPECEVRAFGSRVTWTAGDNSDLDLVVVGAGKLDWRTMAGIRDAFEESMLPFRVDLLDWHVIPESFRKNILREYEVIQRGNTEAGNAVTLTDGGWKRRTTSDLIAEGILTINDGYRAKNVELSEHGIPFARAGNINNGFNFDKANRFPLEYLPKVGIKRSQPGDVVFTSKGTVGRFAFVKPSTQEFVYSPQLCFWRSNDQSILDSRFLYYWMQSTDCLAQINALKGQTDMADYVSLQDQRNMTISFPAIQEQKAIAHILGSLDDKIELNRRMNETLEAMARAIFKSWFVDFDPVRARRGELPFTLNLPPEILNLFPDSFEDSELGEIPRGWEVLPLPELFDVNPTRTLKRGVKAPYLEMKNMPENSSRALGWYEREYGSGVKFINGDTLMARITPCLENGKAVFVDFLKDGQVGWGSTEYIVLRNKGLMPLEYSYFLSRTPDFRSYAIVNMTGSSGRQRVPASIFNFYLVVNPNEQVAEHFGKISGPIMQKIKENDEESNTLASLRDTLLPKLISGELRIPDAERFIAEAGA